MSLLYGPVSVIGSPRLPDIGMEPRKSCMFGKVEVADGSVAMHVPEKCVSLVCQDGTIVEKMTGEMNDTGCKY